MQQLHRKNIPSSNKVTRGYQAWELERRSNLCCIQNDQQENQKAPVQIFHSGSRCDCVSKYSRVHFLKNWQRKKIREATWLIASGYGKQKRGGGEALLCEEHRIKIFSCNFNSPLNEMLCKKLYDRYISAVQNVYDSIKHSFHSLHKKAWARVLLYFKYGRTIPLAFTRGIRKLRSLFRCLPGQRTKFPWQWPTRLNKVPMLESLNKNPI